MERAAAQPLQGRYLSIAGIAAIAIACAVGEARAADAITSFQPLQFPGQVEAQKQATPACPGGICPGLANVFYLPETNAASTLTGGTVMFTKRKLDECATYSTIERGQRNFATADNMQTFVSNTMASFNLSGDYKTSELTVKGTASVMTGSSSDIRTSFTSRQLDVSMLTGVVDFELSTTCYSEGNIDPAFLEAFEALAPIDVTKVSEAAQWAPYESFLKQRGSHIMVQQLIGSRFEQWISSTSTATDIGKILEIKACAEVEGVKSGGGWSVATCAAYTTEEKQKALRQQSFDKRIVAGGTRETRTKVLQGVITPEALDDFVAAAPDGTEAVSSTFQPVWRILIDIYTLKCAKSGKGSKDCANLQRAYNLQATYEGWVAIGCPKENDQRANVMQQMAVDSTSTYGINTYRCLLSKTGCRSNDDCHLGGGGSVCYCYGQGCIDTGDPIPGSTYFRNKVRGSKSGSYDEGVNNSCTYRIGVWCGCNSSWAGGLPERTVYRQSTPP